MSTITTRSGKGSPLTNTEVDNNFTNLNTDKIEADSTNTLTNKTIDDMSNTVGANHLHYKVKATATLSKGVVVKITGYNSGEDAYEVAAVSSSSDVAVGIVDSSLANGDFGLITNTGLFEGLDTSSFSVGDILYPNSSGGFTSTKPTTGTYQAAAFVLRSHATNGAVMTEFTEPHDANLAAFSDAITLPTSDGTSGQALITDGAGNISFGDVDALPSQTGNSGKYLTTDGTDPSWADVDSLPDQTGNSGKYLITDGTNASWSTVSEDQTVSLTGSGATTVTGTYPNFTISSTDTDTNTTYTAGTGLTLTGTTFSNSAPDQTVTLTGSGATSVSGTYPNFTISSTDTNTQLSTEQVQDIIGAMVSGNTETNITVTYDDTNGKLNFSNGAPDQTVTLTGSGATTVSGTYPSFTISSTDTNTQLSTEQVQDIVGAMFSGNTESGISVTYQDADGTIDLSVGGVTVAMLSGSAVQTSAEAFSDSDSVLMTAAAVADKIESYGYTTQVGDITGVTAGSGLTGGGTSGSVTLSHADTSSQASVDNSGATVIQDVTLDTYGHITALASKTLTAADVGAITGNQTITLSGDVSGSGTTSITTTVANDSHSHTTSTLSGNISAFTNDAGYTTNVGDITGVTAGSYLTGGGTSGSVTLNVDATSASTASKVVARDSSGDINARLFRSEYDTTNSSINYIMTQVDTASNNYIRPSTPAQFRSAVTDGSYPTKTGGGASGTWGISITGNAGSVDGYSASTTRNAANTIPVRDANGYLQLGWINTTSGTAGTINKIYCSQDDYVRYLTPAAFKSQLGVAETKANGCVYENAQTISSNYTMTTNYNGHSVGDITINSGVTVTIPTGSNWVVS